MDHPSSARGPRAQALIPPPKPSRSLQDQDFQDEVLREPLGVRFVRGTEGRNWACGFGALRPAGFGRDPLQPPASPLAPQGNETVQRQKPGSPDCRFFFFPGKTLPSPDGRTDTQTDAHGLCLGRLGWDRLFVWGAVAFGAAAAAGGGGRRKGGPFGGFQGGSDQGRPPPQWQGC